MSVFFDNVDVAINKSGFFATSANVKSSAFVEAAYSVGYYNEKNTVTTGPLVTSFSFDYIPEINNEPNFSTVNKIKSLIPETGYAGERIDLAGIVQNNCFLQKYTLKIQPNSLAQCSVEYVTFFSPCDFYSQKSNRILYSKDGSLIHSFSTYLLNANDHLSKPVYNFEYDFSVAWTPVYVIGKKYPVNIKLLGATERLSFASDIFRNVLFNGEKLSISSLFNTGDSQNIQFGNISLICSDNCNVANGDDGAGYLKIPIDGFKIIDADMLASLGEYVRVNYNCVKYY